ncbi:MAG: 3-deoxy-7-phosphoheptulonate synthase [Candidatus Sumerlaeia bacterium]
MIIVLRKDATQADLDHIIEKIQQVGLKPHISKGVEKTLVGAIGEDDKIAQLPIEAFPGVESVMRLTRPYKLASREFQPEDTMIEVGGVTIGGRQIIVGAGPCSVERGEHFFRIAEEIKKAGASMLRGGAFKPRTSPYSFQGLGREGLEILAEARRRTGLAIVTEVMDTRQVELVCEFADMIQIGARNIQNFDLLREVGRTQTPVLLKRGMATTYKEFLMSAEYIMDQGNKKVVLCERGIRTFETHTRNTLDVCAVPVLQFESHLPVFVDPSHAGGYWRWVEPLARAAVAAGADGLLIEVHTNPEEAWSDGAQTLRTDKFARLIEGLRRVAASVDRTI